MYFRRHADIAVQHGCGVILEAPTWRASRDWGARIGYPAAELRRVNESAAALLSQVRSEYRDAAASSPVVVSGCIGPRADAYRPAERMGEGEAEDYHSEQIAILAATEVDLVHAMTITYASEAIGIARAAAGAGIPAVISFTTETDGRLPDGASLGDAVAAVDAATGGSAAYYGVNCAHPSHFASALTGDLIGARLRSIRANASRMSHAELDESPTRRRGSSGVGRRLPALARRAPLDLHRGWLLRHRRPPRTGHRRRIPSGHCRSIGLGGRFTSLPPTAALLVTAGLIVAWIPFDVRGLGLVLARDWHGVQSAARTRVQSGAGTGLLVGT